MLFWNRAICFQIWQLCRDSNKNCAVQIFPCLSGKVTLGKATQCPSFSVKIGSGIGYRDCVMQAVGSDLPSPPGSCWDQRKWSFMPPAEAGHQRPHLPLLPLIPSPLWSWTLASQFNLIHSVWVDHSTEKVEVSFKFRNYSNWFPKKNHSNREWKRLYYL